jgi:hypothetical protein
MNETNFLAISGKAGIVLNAALLLTLAGCGDNAGSSSPGAPPPATAAVQAAAPADAQASSSVVVQVTPPAEVAQDDYVYYPAYGVYYSGSRHQYASLQDGAWISEAAPRGVAVNDLRASPSVKMDFHDAPANHHAEIAKQYPKDWKPGKAN